MNLLFSFNQLNLNLLYLGYEAVRYPRRFQFFSNKTIINAKVVKLSGFFPNLTYLTSLASLPKCNYIAALQGFYFVELFYWQMKRESVTSCWGRRLSRSEAAILIAYHERKLGV